MKIPSVSAYGGVSLVGTIYGFSTRKRKDTIDFWQAGKEQEFLSHRTESAVVSSVRKTQTLVKAEGEKVTEIKGQWQGGHKPGPSPETRT